MNTSMSLFIIGKPDAQEWHSRNWPFKLALRILHESQLGASSALGPYMAVLPEAHPSMLWRFSASEIAEFQVVARTLLPPPTPPLQPSSRRLSPFTPHPHPC